MLTLPISSLSPRRSRLIRLCVLPARLVRERLFLRRDRIDPEPLAGFGGSALEGFNDHQLRDLGLHRIPDSRTSHAYTPSGHRALLGFSLTSSF